MSQIRSIAEAFFQKKGYSSTPLNKVEDRPMKRTIVALLLALPMSALAQGYIGGGIGITSAEFLDCQISSICDNEDTGFKVFGGYQFNQNFAVEGGYLDPGEATFSEPGVFSGIVEGSTIFFHAVGMIPINKQFSVLGKIGLHMWEAKETGQIFGAPFSVDDDGTDLTFGFGGQFNFDRFSLRAEWERYDFDDIDVDFMGVSALIRF